MIDLKEVIFHLIDGLEEWETNKSRIPAALQQGHRMLSQALMEMKVPPPADYVALLKLLQRPIPEWGLPLNDDPPIEQPLVIPYIGLSSAAKEFKLIYDSPQEAHVKEVLKIVQYCRNRDPQMDEEYRKIRQFLITKPVVSFTELLTFGVTLNDAELLKSLQNCFEDITQEALRYRQCPRCGWTLERRNDAWRCGDEDICGQLMSRKHLKGWKNNSNQLYRLKAGVYRYTMLPGLAELHAYQELQQQGYSVTMFPQVDRFDLEVDIGQRSIYLDLKDFSSPFTLARFFNNQTDRQLQKYAETGVYVVVPRYRIKRYPDYIPTFRRLLRPHSSHIRILDEKNVVRMLQRGGGGVDAENLS